jgi:hypothetical protein
VIVDVRDGTEVAASGKAKGALAVSRGLLEFRADPDLTAHNRVLCNDRSVILYCGLRIGGTGCPGWENDGRYGLHGRTQCSRVQRIS